METQHIQHIEISRDAYRHNLATFRRLLAPGCRLMAVVKANAYGHGLLPIARLAAEAGADYLGVNALEEAAALRVGGIGLPTAVLGYIPLHQLGDAVALGVEPVLYNLDALRRLQHEAARQGRPAPFHLKLETGVHRQGVMEADLPAFIDAIRAADHLVFQGVGMHFANIEDTTDHSFARIQQAAFQRMTDALAAAGLTPRLRHTACSAATILFPATHGDLVRVGISSYGLWPSKETYLATILQNQQPPVLQPVLTWKTRIAQVKEVPADSFVGYGCSYRTTQRIRLAVLPVGYYDGYDRGLSNQGHVLVGGRRAPVLGRICMNMIMVDVTHIPDAAVESEVVLLGGQGPHRVTAEELAALCHTINYEIVSRLGAHIPRLVV
jgi:alanine racemase